VLLAPQSNDRINLPSDLMGQLGMTHEQETGTGRGRAHGAGGLLGDATYLLDVAE
jgi:hypothetical protein